MSECKHKYAGDNPYCRLCGGLSEPKARIFIHWVLRIRQMSAQLSFGSDGQVTVNVTRKGARANIADLRQQLETKIKKTALEVTDGSG